MKHVVDHFDFPKLFSTSFQLTTFHQASTYSFFLFCLNKYQLCSHISNPKISILFSIKSEFWLGVVQIFNFPLNMSSQAQPEPNIFNAALVNVSLNLSKLPKIWFIS